MRRTRGFTLIELMVVITIIALLLTILLPGLAKALELARRAKCGANLKGIGEGLATKDAEKVMYSSGGSGLPWADGTTAAEPHLTGVGTGDRGKDPWATTPAPLTEYPVSTNMYALIHRADVEPAAFVCPSTPDEVDDDIIAPTGEKYWDFVDNDSLSYSYQAPLDDGAGTESSPFVNTHSSVVIMADQNPISVTALNSNGQPGDEDEAQSDWSTVMVDLEEPHAGTMMGQSANHKGEYVNALRFDGTLKTSFAANIGYDKDCIWTPGGLTNTNNEWEDNEYTGSASPYTVSQHRKPNDSFLIDTPDN